MHIFRNHTRWACLIWFELFVSLCWRRWWIVTIFEVFSNFNFSSVFVFGRELLFGKNDSLKSVSKSQSIELALLDDVDDKDEVSLLNVEDLDNGDVLYFLVLFFLDMFVFVFRLLFWVVAIFSSFIVWYFAF